MKPYLLKFDENENIQGKYCLYDTTEAKVTEERNGAFELIFSYPEDGEFFTDITLMSIILAKANPYGEPQYFRISRITKPINGLITVYCYHISYDLSGVPVMPYSANSAGAAINGLQANAVVQNSFTFWTDKNTTGSFNNKVPSSLRSLMGGQQGSILDVYGGEWEFDNYTIKLHNQRGANRGVRIAYGKNLLDITQEEECANVYTAVCPYWADNNGANIVTLPEKTIQVEGTFTFTRILTLDLSSDFDNKPTVEQLRNKANSYISSNGVGVPKVNLKVNYIDLTRTEEYKNTVLNERVDLCDTVTVQFERLGVSATAKCIKTVYDVLTDRYDSIELGDARSNFAAKMAAQTLKLDMVPTTSFMQQAVDNATQTITGNMGGYVVLRDADGNGQPDEILIMDTPDVNTAQKVWRWNSGGLGYSSTGVDGTYGTAITANGEIVADFITTGSLNAALITAGVISNAAKTSFFDLDGGRIYTKSGNYYAESIGYAFNISANGNKVATLSCAADGSGGLLNFKNTNNDVVMQLNNTGLNYWDPTTKHARLTLNADGATFRDANGNVVIDIEASKIALKNTSGTEVARISSTGVKIGDKTYTPMNIDFKDSRGANQTMQILCAGLI